MEDYIGKGLVVKQTHPTLPLSIYNYSRTCQFGRYWDDVTLNCRALILDNEGNVIAKLFQKFFNIEELGPHEIPNEPFEVFEKMDGSLGLFFHYQGEWYMATKGSFISEQSVRGMKIARKYNLDKICVPGYTYIFEIIYPENMICVNYGESERLVLLSIMDSDGVEIPYEDIVESGESQQQLYNHVVQQLQNAGVKELYAVGPQLCSYFKEAAYPFKVHCFEQTSNLLEALNESYFQQQYILLKGARKFAFEPVS